MASIEQQAVISLNDQIESLLTAVGTGVERTWFLVPTRVIPAGIGGFIGVNSDPCGDIFGNHITAIATFTLRASDRSKLSSAITKTINNLSAQNRQTLVSKGILRCALDEKSASETVITKGADGFETILRFNILFEYLELPLEPQGIIQKIPIDLDLDIEGSDLIYKNDFLTDPSADFVIVDDPKVTKEAPSQWQYNSTDQRIEQLKRTRGGYATATPNKPGTYYILGSSADQFAVENFSLTTKLSSDDENGIGMVYRWIDQDNFYFFLLSCKNSFRLFGRKVSGTFQEMGEGGLDKENGYEKGILYTIHLNVSGTSHKLFLNDKLALQARDSSIIDKGRAGFLSYGNNRSYFYNIKLMRSSL